MKGWDLLCINYVTYFFISVVVYLSIILLWLLLSITYYWEINLILDFETHVGQ